MTTPSTRTEPAQERLLTRPFALLTLAELAYFTAVGVAVYALPLYVTGPLGADKASAGVAFGAFAISALVLRPFVGRWSDAWGRRPLLVGGALLAAVGLALTAAAGSLIGVFALRLLLGVAEAAFFVAAFAALADLAPASRMGEALSYNSLGLYLGLALGPPFGELLVRTLGFAAAWLGASALAAIAALIVLGVGETRVAVASEVRPKLIHRRAIPPSLGFFASLLAMGGFLSLAALYAQEIGVANTSTPLFVYGAVVVACRIAFAKLPDRMPPLALGAVALTTMAAGLTLLAVRPTPLGMLTGTVLLAVGVSFSTPAFFAAIFATARPSERGAASGTATVFMDLGLGFGPIALGAVAQATSIGVALAAGAICALVGAIWVLRLRAADR